MRAARWSAQAGRLKPILHPQRVALKDLLAIDEQKQRVDANTRQFVAGNPANNVLLTGARGCGKSSLVKAVHAKYAPKGLRLIEVDKAGAAEPARSVRPAGRRASTASSSSSTISPLPSMKPATPASRPRLTVRWPAPSDNVLIYATSNRRHLMPEYMAENLETQYLGGEVHPGEATEEKVSLSDRFGLWVSFHVMDQDTYLDIARHWAASLGAPADEPSSAPRCNGRWGVAHAMAGWRGSSRATGQAAR